MTRRGIIAVMLLCFIVSAAGAGFHMCLMDAPKEGTTAGMEDCPMMAMNQKPDIPKKSCMDLACPSCFSMPPVGIQASYQPDILGAESMADHNDSLAHYSQAVPDRPPKRA